MKVKFSRCNSNSLANVPQVDGQMTFVKDTQEVYMDVGNNRTKVTDIIFKSTLNALQNDNNLLENKLYYVSETNKLYHYNSTSQELEEVKTSAEETSFDNTGTSLESNNVEDAIKEIDRKIGDLSDAIDALNGEVV